MGRRPRHAVVRDRWWLEALDDEAQSRAALWETATHWHWIDAAAWVASHRSRVMALLSGYRDYRDRSHSIAVDEGACRTVLQMHLREPAIASAERQLRAWCRAGLLEAVAIPTGAILSQVDWHAGREPVASGMPMVMFRADALRELSPASIAPIATEAVIEAPARVDSFERDAECKRVAALLDEAGISVRRVRATDIAQLWNSDKGKPLSVPSVTVFMTGGDKGRPAAE